MVVMTGLYADSKLKAESIKRFGIDDFLVKPVSITDLINLLQRHLEGVLDLPAQENLYDLHRKEFDAGDGRNSYEVACFTCGDMFDSVKADWCAHAGGDNTLVCEHCGNCFCQAAEYRARFWSDAPAVLFERKMIHATRDRTPVSNPPPESVKRPLIELMEDDEATQFLVRTVVSTLGYGFIVSENTDDTRSAGREYTPDLVLVDAWLPNRDGRAICRELKEDGARAKTIIMTGRYADPDYRQEAQSQFDIDGCIAKPLAASDLLGLIKKYAAQEVRAK
jgi:DNA-binding response OmpR family regulator